MQSEVSASQKDRTVRVLGHIGDHALSKKKTPLLLIFRRYRYSVLPQLLSEIRNLIRRMEWIRDIHKTERHHGKASVEAWIADSGVPSEHKCAYIPHMQHMEVLHPFLSIVNYLLLAQSWKAGLEYGIRIGKLQSQVKERS